MLSRILGLVRDIVIAHFFGAGSGSDAFFVAFKIPNFLRRLFAEGAFSQAFVPVLSEYKIKHPKEAVQLLVDRVAGTFGLTLCGVTLLGVAGAPVLIMLFAPGFIGQEAKLLLAGDMLRLTFPYLLFISLTAFSGAILNTYGRFAVPAFTPVLLNLSLIAAVFLLSPHLSQPVMALAWGVLAAGLAQLLFQLPFLLGVGLLPRPKLKPKQEGVSRIMRLMIPALFGVSVSQINLLLDTVLASFLETGSISWLYYSDRLSELPLGVFGIAIGTVILPSLSKDHAKDSSSRFGETLDWAVRMVLLVGLPAALALFVLAEPLIATLFHYGALTDNDVIRSAESLRAYSLGLVAFMLVKVLAPGYFARQDTKTPVSIAIKAMAANMVLNLILVFPLAHAGLALATSISAFLNAGLLWWGLHKAGLYQTQTNWLKYGLWLMLANGLMVVAIWWGSPEVEIWLNWGALERITRLAMLCVGGVALYIVMLLACGLRLRHLRR